MEAGVEYERRRLHGKRYFAEVMRRDLIDRELRPLLEFSRSQTEELSRMDDRLLRLLAEHPRLAARVEALRKIDGVGPVTALSWALEVGDPARFASIKRAGKSAGRCPSSAIAICERCSSKRPKSACNIISSCARSMTRPRRKVMPIELRWPWRASWWRICWPPIAPSSPRPRPLETCIFRSIADLSK
jgi:hypothetical protein